MGRVDGELLPPAGLSVEIIDAEAECLSTSEVADRVASRKPVLAAVVVVWTPAVGLHADYDGGRPYLLRRQGSRRRSSRCCCSAGTSRRCRNARFVRRKPTSSPAAKGFSRWFRWRKRLESPGTDLSGRPWAVVPRPRSDRPRPGRDSRSKARLRVARHRVGPSPTPATAPQLALPRRTRPPTVRRDLHHPRAARSQLLCSAASRPF